MRRYILLSGLCFLAQAFETPEQYRERIAAQKRHDAAIIKVGYSGKRDYTTVQVKPVQHAVKSEPSAKQMQISDKFLYYQLGGLNFKDFHDEALAIQGDDAMIAFIEKKIAKLPKLQAETGNTISRTRRSDSLPVRVAVKENAGERYSHEV